MNCLLIEDIPATALQREFVEQLCRQMQRELLAVSQEPDDIEQYAEQNEVDILFVYCRNTSRRVQHYLNACRSLRIPYIFLTDSMQHLSALQRIVLPVSMLEEEVHKAHIASHLARRTQAEILLLQAKDYGSRARQNTQKIITALSQFDLRHEVLIAKTDSFHLTKECTDRQRELHADMLLLTASRDYGLDDLIFGPAERHAILHSHCPVLLLNPRGDLYSLCD